MLSRIPSSALRATLGLAAVFWVAAALPAQEASPAAVLHTGVRDSSGAAVSGARVAVRCGGHRAAVVASASEQGEAQLAGLIPGLCVAEVSAAGFGTVRRELSLTAGRIFSMEVTLPPAEVNATVVVSARDDELRALHVAAQGSLEEERIGEIVVQGHATAFTDILTRTTPGVAADANGFAHPLGEHADTSISLDGQPITDQMAKIFSNQIDVNTIQTMHATTGAPPVAFGDKTSLVVEITTRSGLDRRPSGTLALEAASFGTWSGALTLGAGTPRWGNFLALSGGGSGRFLDTPEFMPLHDRGNNAGVFDRIDWQPTERDSLHLNLIAGRSWFQTPLSYDSAALGQDQRSQIRNGNVAFGWTHIVRPNAFFSFVPFLRHDEARYLPSANSLADRPATLEQARTLTNTGFRAEGVYARGLHNIKAGATYWHTLLDERFAVGLTDPLYNAVCVDGAANPVAAAPVRAPEDCVAAGYRANPDFLARLLPYDLSRGGTLYNFHETADIEEAAFYAEDAVTLGNLLLTAGLRYDIYNGLSRGRQLQPRIGMGWRTPWSGTRLRLSYARLYETPYNENLIFANESSADQSTANPFGSYRSEPVRPGTRNQFNTGFEQDFGRYLSVNADYYWKFTHTAFDFDTLFNTPITFSVAWRKSKIDGLALRASLNDFHGLSLFSVMGHVRSRFFTPEVGGLIFNSVPSNPVFRIDHGEEFEQTTEMRYQLPPRSVFGRAPWLDFVWRYNSGLALPGIVPVYTDALELTADEQAQIGLSCGRQQATLTQPIRICSAVDFRAKRIRIPPPGTFNDDRNPVRVTSRTLFDLSIGEDNLLRWDRARLGLRLTVINLANKVSLYNFLSTFSGTHFVPPRTFQAGLQFTF